MIVIRARPHCEVPTQVRVTASLIAAARVITTHKMKREMMIIGRRCEPPDPPDP
jgi:hypothetical protein